MVTLNYTYHTSGRFTKGLYLVYIFFNCRHFFEFWQHSFDIVRFIFKRGLFSGEGKSCAPKVCIVRYITACNSISVLTTTSSRLYHHMQRALLDPPAALRKNRQSLEGE